MADLHTFDWVGSTTSAPDLIPTRLSDMTLAERNQRTIEFLSSACVTCTMCELGLTTVERGGISRDPHVFSNLNQSKFFVVGQSPEFDSVEKGEPLVGVAGQNFDAEIQKYGLTRQDFYICNIIRCFTKQPTDEHCQRCEPYLRMEINIMRPKMIVALGAVAFGQLCPDAVFDESLKKLVKSKYGVSVFAVYDPCDSDRREQFDDQIKVMCGLVQAIRAREQGQAVGQH